MTRPRSRPGRRGGSSGTASVRASGDRSGARPGSGRPPEAPPGRTRGYVRRTEIALTPRSIGGPADQWQQHAEPAAVADSAHAPPVPRRGHHGDRLAIPADHRSSPDPDRLRDVPGQPERVDPEPDPARLRPGPDRRDPADPCPSRPLRADPPRGQGRASRGRSGRRRARSSWRASSCSTRASSRRSSPSARSAARSAIRPRRPPSRSAIVTRWRRPRTSPRTDSTGCSTQPMRRRPGQQRRASRTTTAAARRWRSRSASGASSMIPGRMSPISAIAATTRPSSSQVRPRRPAEPRIR